MKGEKGRERKGRRMGREGEEEGREGVWRKGGKGEVGHVVDG